MEADLIKKIRIKLDLNQTEFAELIGVSKRSVANYESGNTEPNQRTQLKILGIEQRIVEANYHQKDPLVYVREKEYHYKAKYEEEKRNPIITDESYFENSSESLPKASDKGVPYYDVDFYGGFDFAFNDQTILPAFFIDYAPYNDCDAWINVSGKSMSPFISHGDIAALKKLNSWREFIPFGEIYAVLTDEHKTIKIVTAGKDEYHLTLVPYNKGREFVEQQIPKKLIHQMYRVKGSIKKFF